MPTIKTFLIAYLSLFGAFSAAAQTENFKWIFPWQPDFSVKQATELGYARLSISQETYLRGEQDQRGYVWSQALGNAQQTFYAEFSDGRPALATHFLPDGRAKERFVFHEKSGLISVVEHWEYQQMPDPQAEPNSQDSLWDAVLKEQWVYTYDQNDRPFQKVRLFSDCAHCRALYDWTWDSLQRPLRERVQVQGFDNQVNTRSLAPAKKSRKSQEETGVAYARKWQAPVVEEGLTLWEYENSYTSKRNYRKMHELLQSEETEYGEEGNPLRTRRFTLVEGKRKLLQSTTFTYSGKQLQRSETRYEADANNPLIEAKTIYQYYEYDENGFPARIIEEEGNKQKVFTYTFTQ